MIKKLFITILLITAVSSNFILSSTISEETKNEDLQKRILDINSANALIDTYSNLFNELIPANAK
jgi:hypothetical protein